MHAIDESKSREETPYRLIKSNRKNTENGSYGERNSRLSLYSCNSVSASEHRRPVRTMAKDIKSLFEFYTCDYGTSIGIGRENVCLLKITEH